MPKLDLERINRLIDESEMSLTSMSGDIDVHPGLLRRMKTEANYNPGVFTLLKFANYFNIKIDDLIKE